MDYGRLWICYGKVWKYVLFWSTAFTQGVLFAGWKRYLDTAKLCEAARLGQDRQGIRMNKVSNDSAMMCVCVCVFAVRRCQKRRTQLGLGGWYLPKASLTPKCHLWRNHVICLAWNSTPKKNDNNAIFTHMHPHDPSCTKLKMFENRAVSENHLSIQQWLPLVLEALTELVPSNLLRWYLQSQWSLVTVYWIHCDPFGLALHCFQIDVKGMPKSIQKRETRTWKSLIWHESPGKITSKRGRGENMWK